MPTSPLNGVIHVLADLRSDGDGMTDGELLGRFVRSRDHDAIAILVRRHAPMVWGVCRRLLHKHQDAEDAFQATFLVLARKAADVPRQAVANWLYGVARQTAVRLRAIAAKRRRRETQVVNMPEPTVAEVRDAGLHFVLDEELSRLPDHYRGVVVLCDLEGLTRKEAARQLGIPEGSVASRLARARVMLARRLTRRGLVLTGGLAAAASAPPALVASTIQAASLLATGPTAAVVSATVADLTERMVKTMFLTKIKSVLAAVLILAALAGGAGLIYQSKSQAAFPEKPAPGTALIANRNSLPPTKEEKLKALIDNVLAAYGGEEKLNQLQFTMTVKHSNGETQHYFVQPPKNFRWETTREDSTHKRIVILFPTGRHWWTQEQNEAPKSIWLTGMEPKVEYWYEYVKFFGPRHVLRLKDPNHKVSLLDEEIKIDGRAAEGVQVNSWQMYFDKETHLLVKQNHITYRDYKKFDGIPIPQKENDGYFLPEVIDFRVVDKFDPKLFEKP